MLNRTTKSYIAVLVLICILYAVFRLRGVTDACLWFDEIFSVHAAEHSWNAFIPFIAKDLIHPPLFYLLLKIWIAVNGDGLLSVRLAPETFAIFSIVPFLMLCRELKLRPLATTLAFSFFAANGVLIKYAQEVRMYSLLLLLSLTSIWLFSRFYFRGKSFWVLVVANILLVYTHYFGWFVVAAEFAAIMLNQRPKVPRTWLMAAIAAAAFLPWVGTVLNFADGGLGLGQNLGWIQSPGISAIVDLALDLVDPFYFQESSGEATANFAVAIPLLIVFLIAFILRFVRSRKGDEGESIKFLALICGVPLVLAFVLSWLLPVSIWGTRHLLIVFPQAMMLGAVVLNEIDSSLVRRSMIACILVLTTAGLTLQLVRTKPNEQIWCAWESLAKNWAADPRSNSQPKRLYVFEDLVAYHYWFATRELPGYEIVLVKGIQGMPNDPAYFLPRGFDGVKTADIGSIDANEVWISFRKNNIEKLRESAISNEMLASSYGLPVSSFEDRGYEIVDVKEEVQILQTAYLIRMVKATDKIPQQ